MKDSEIIKLYESRSESAITETDKKYGTYCQSIAYRILYDRGEAEECVNDSYFKAWNAIPPAVPKILSVFIGKIVRNTALDMYDRKKRLKRGGGEFPAVLDELLECVDEGENIESKIESKETNLALKEFLDGLDVQKRRIFVLRYWHVMPVKEIAQRQGMKESNVKIILHRLRKQLAEELRKRELI